MVIGAPFDPLTNMRTLRNSMRIVWYTASAIIGSLFTIILYRRMCDKTSVLFSELVFFVWVCFSAAVDNLVDEDCS